MDRFDYQQQQDQEEREAETLQALMEISAFGLQKQAEFLAHELGLGSFWQQHFQPTRTK